MAIQHLLVPTDFSLCAAHALDYAITLAQRLQARVTLLHVIATMWWGPEDVPVAAPCTSAAAIEAAFHQRLAAGLQRIHAAGLAGESQCLYGVPFECIITAARDHGVDLIVMGTHGHTDLPHLLIGSVAERVVRLAPCPVLVTRGTVPIGEAPSPDTPPGGQRPPERGRRVSPEPSSTPPR